MILLGFIDQKKLYVPPWWALRARKVFFGGISSVDTRQKQAAQYTLNPKYLDRLKKSYKITTRKTNQKGPPPLPPSPPIEGEGCRGGGKGMKKNV